MSQSHGPKRRSRRTAAGCQMQITSPLLRAVQAEEGGFFYVLEESWQAASHLGPGPRDDTVAIAAQRAGGKSGSHANRQTGY